MNDSVEQLSLVKDIMTSPVISVSLNQTVKQVLLLSKKQNVTGFPVVDINQKVIGVISTLDLLTEMAIGKLHLKLGELPLVIKVEKDVIQLKPDTPIKSALMEVIKKRVGRVIITDDEDKLCGIVSRKDLLNYFIDINRLEA